MSATKQYELVYIAAPEATEQQLAELHELVVGIAAKFNGTIDRTEAWGRRRLAYTIGRHKEGIYVLEVIIGQWRPGQGARSPAEGVGPRHPPSRRPRRRGPGDCGARQGAAPGDVGPPPRGARPAG